MERIVHREEGRAAECRCAPCLLCDADEQERRIERQCGEAVDGQAERLAGAIDAGRDGHPGSKAAEGVAKRTLVGSAPIFAMVRIERHCCGL